MPRGVLAVAERGPNGPGRLANPSATNACLLAGSSKGVCGTACLSLTPNRDKVELVGELSAGSGTWDVVWTDKDNLEIIPQSGAKSDSGEAAVRELWERVNQIDELSWISASAPAEIPNLFGRQFGRFAYAPISPHIQGVWR